MSLGRPTLGDVARLAGVHKATASRALNSSTATRVHPETAKRVRTAADTLGYRPNMQARALRTRSTSTIGVVVPDIVNPLYPPMVRGIEDALSRRGYTALIANTDLDPDRERTALDTLLSRQVEALIVGVSDDTRALCEDLAKDGTPIVLLDNASDLDGVSGIESDNVAGVDAVVDHLVALGHRSIAHLGGPEHMLDPPRRTSAFRAAFARHGLDEAACPVVSVAELTPTAAAGAVDRLLDRYPDVTGIACYNDLLAVGALGALSARDLDCPADVSVVGFNDLPWVTYLTPSLTTVRVDTKQAGYAAATLLLSILDGIDGVVHQYLPVSLMPRESTGPAPVG